uniref:Uncharacterized protein n=1 Tax=Schistosoma japonicum TaxID=6182 RepID=Q5DHR2_SCHJA|nr:unknown [Schistosoma japonicum]
MGNSPERNPPIHFISISQTISCILLLLNRCITSKVKTILVCLPCTSITILRLTITIIKVPNKQISKPYKLVGSRRLKVNNLVMHGQPNSQSPTNQLHFSFHYLLNYLCIPIRVSNINHFQYYIPSLALAFSPSQYQNPLNHKKKIILYQSMLTLYIHIYAPFIRQSIHL